MVAKGTFKITMRASLRDFEFYVLAEENINLEELINSYSRRLSEVEKSMETLEKRLSTENFLKKAPEEEVQRTKEALEELREERERIQRPLGMLQEAR